jgi:tRNA threonylcarbamoyladenosine biosynthesis protein TsaB
MSSINSLHSAHMKAHVNANMSANEPFPKLLAFDTSTETMFIAVTDGHQTWLHTAEGGAKTSAALIPAIMALLKEADLTLRQLDAIVFGRGPGSFTGLRTACSVAQGLAFGAGGIPVLPINTLLAVAEEARFTTDEESNAVSNVTQIQAVLDARMGEVYSASYAYKDGAWDVISDIQLCKPDQLQLEAGFLLAGNCLDSHRINALPTATAMLRLAPAMLVAGLSVPADQALPLYVRDKVAQTTAERTALKLAP